MQRALQIFTPRVKPINYSSLRGELGCQQVIGNRVNTLRPIATFCRAPHNENSAIFNQSDQLSFATGPVNNGDPPPFATDWAVWVATKGVRGGKYSTITLPSDTLGEESQLYARATPRKVSLAHDALGRPYIAAQIEANVIEIKRGDSLITSTTFDQFEGTSPVLFFTGLLAVDGAEVACIYIKPEHPARLYARTSDDDFATEYLLNLNLPGEIDRLIQAEVASIIEISEHSIDDSRSMVLYARDKSGFDITMFSEAYTAESEDAVELEVGFGIGSYVTGAVDESADDPMAITLNFDTTGSYTTTAITETLTADESALTLGFSTGSYS